MRHFSLLLFLVLGVFESPPASAAPKTDIVLFKNGDKLTGEVKSLKRGRLSLNTDATGTIDIEWDKIEGVVSNQQIQVEVGRGVRYFGILTLAEKGDSDTGAEIIVGTEDGPVKLAAERVIVMEPIEGTGIHALDVDVSLGYNFAKAGGVEQGSFSLNMDWRSLIRIESLRFSTTISDSDTQDASQRTTLGLQHTRLWNNRWFSNAGLSFERNDELGLNLRTSLSAGGGRYLIQSNQMLLSLQAGLQVAREDLFAQTDHTDSLETTFTAEWDWFVFQNPELDWSTRLQLIPSLTESGRVRGEFETSLDWEIIGDLDWGISLYTSYDSQPQSATGASSDYGIDTRITYDF